jgi:fucose permease
MGAGRLFFGRLREIPANATVISLFCLALIIVAIAFVRHEIVMLILFAVSGFASSCIWPGIINTAVSLNRNASGALISYLNLGVGIGGSVVPLAIGKLMDAANMTVSFLVLTVLTAVAGIYMRRNTGDSGNK